MSQRVFPGIFDLSNVTSSNWCKALASEILKFAQDLFTSPSPSWVGVTVALRTRKCLASLAKTRPDKFEKFYSHDNLNLFTEGAFWLGANKVLGSCWHMKFPILACAGAPKGLKKVAFHHAPGVTVLLGQSGIFLCQPGTCSGDCQEAIDMTAEVQQFHSSTYITIGLPRAALLANETYNQTIHDLLDVFNLPWTIDASFLIYVFLTKVRNNSQARPLRARSWRDQSPDKTSLEIYAHQVWIRLR